MNDALLTRGLDALKDPAFLDRLDAELRVRREQREAFKQSHTFQLMCDCLRNNREPISVDSEECLYQSEQVAARVGWGNISVEDVNHFFSIMSTDIDDVVCEHETEEDESIPFDNESFVNYGLHVFCMYGQGSFIRVSNLVSKVGV